MIPAAHKVLHDAEATATAECWVVGQFPQVLQFFWAQGLVSGYSDFTGVVTVLSSGVTNPQP